MTAATGFKRLGIALLVLVAAGAAGILTAGSLISTESVRRQALNELRAVTGLDPTVRGPVSISLFPSGNVSFGDVMLGSANRPALTAERLTAHLRFLPLLIGRAEIADVSLERPTIAVDIDANGRSNWSGLIAALARSQKPDSQRGSTFSEMRIKDGVIAIRDQERNIYETLDDVELSLAWPSISKSFGATGRFVWRAEPVDATLILGDFAAALAGQRTGIKLRLAGAPMKGAFEGALSLEPTLKVEGMLAADSGSLRDALVWFGKRPLPGGGFGRFAIKAKTNVTGGTVGLSGVNVELDGNIAEGVLTFAADSRKTLQGTLASEALDLTPYVSTVRLLTSNRRQWDSDHIKLDGLAGMDLDLRLSAGQVALAEAKLGRTAIGANLRDGHLVITIGEAQAYGGVIKGSVTLTNLAGGVDVKSQLQFTNVELESCLDQLVGLRRLEGSGDISLAVEGSGDSVLAVTRTLNGTASLTGRDGALLGFNVEQLLRRLERRPLSAGGEFRTGRTPFDRITVTLKIVGGKAEVEDMSITGPTVRVALAGSVTIPSREIDLTGTAALVAVAKENTRPFELPFIVQGAWDDPIMLPDAEALIRRSGAAAPLLNAARERGTRDTVRSVLDRLTGGGAPVATPAAEQQSDAPADAQ